MIRNLKPSSVDLAVREALYWAVDGAVYRAVLWDVCQDVTGVVFNGVDQAVIQAVFQAVHFGPPHPHPNLDLFVRGVCQVRGGAT